MNNDLINRLLGSEEPAIRYKIRTRVFGEQGDSHELSKLRLEIKRCPRVRTLLDNLDESGFIRPANNPYSKWQGAHWVIASLADMGYPSGDDELKPICDQVVNCWLHPTYLKDRVMSKLSNLYGKQGVPILEGRARRCASQQGNALYSVVTLGHFDDRCDQLAQLLMHWQWPDGGWNCDKKPEAHKSSFYETITPFRGLIAYHQQTGSSDARESVERSVEVFLSRKMYKRLSDGQRMRSQFTSLHYPNYWHYDILHGLKIMAEGGFIRDVRCSDALDQLESMQLPEGGWPATAKHYIGVDAERNGCDRVHWGGVKQKSMNEWITADALSVFVAAGRLSP